MGTAATVDISLSGLNFMGFVVYAEECGIRKVIPVKWLCMREDLKANYIKDAERKFHMLLNAPVIEEIAECDGVRITYHGKELTDKHKIAGIAIGKNKLLSKHYNEWVKDELKGKELRKNS